VGEELLGFEWRFGLSLHQGGDVGSVILVAKSGSPSGLNMVGVKCWNQVAEGCLITNTGIRVKASDLCIRHIRHFPFFFLTITTLASHYE
jgi:hypothetical protein